jgi:hypothetical protein
MGLEPRIARFPLLRACVERSKHGMESAQGLLLSGERVASLAVRVGPTDLAQLGGLHAVTDAGLAHAPRLAPLFQRRVVQVAVIGQQPCRAVLLRASRVGPELERTPHWARSFRHRRSFGVPVYRYTVCVLANPAVAAKYVWDHKAGWRTASVEVRPAARNVKPLNWLAVGEGEPEG